MPEVTLLNASIHLNFAVTVDKCEGRRTKPGRLSEPQRLLLDVSGQVTLVLTDIAGSTALWEW